MCIKNLFYKKKRQKLSPEDQMWTKFVDLYVGHSADNFSGIERKAVIVFQYDAEVNNGGHSAFFDYWPDIDCNELAEALKEIATDRFAEILCDALENGEEDEYIKVDNDFCIEPSLTRYLYDYVLKNVDKFELL